MQWETNVYVLIILSGVGEGGAGHCSCAPSWLAATKDSVVLKYLIVHDSSQEGDNMILIGHF